MPSRRRVKHVTPFIMCSFKMLHLIGMCHYSRTGPRSAVGNVSGNRCESDCRSRGREFNPGPVPYFRGD